MTIKPGSKARWPTPTQRGLPDLKPLLETLARATRRCAAPTSTTRAGCLTLADYADR